MCKVNRVNKSKNITRIYFEEKGRKLFMACERHGDGVSKMVIIDHENGQLLAEGFATAKTVVKVFINTVVAAGLGIKEASILANAAN